MTDPRHAPLRILPRAGDELDEADRFGDRPHPREMLDFFGHQDVESALLEGYRSGRMHHAFILGGLEGIGKATLAYRFARFVLAHGDPRSEEVRAAANLDVKPDHRAARLLASQAHPDVYALRRSWNADRKTLFSDIRVADVRKANHLFGSTASAGGWRIIIVDSAEDLNANSANALLKVLEEPPPRALFLIIAHQPGRIMPTIRSRCRMLTMRPLDPSSIERIIGGLDGEGHDAGVVRQAALGAEGSVRRALRLLDGGSREFRSRLQALFEALPVIDDKVLLQIAEETTKRDGAAMEDFIEQTEAYLSAAIGVRLGMAPDRVIRFAEAYETFAAARRDVDIYNLDRRPLILATVAEIAEAVRFAAM